MEWLEKSKKPSKERISGKHAREFRMLANVGKCSGIIGAVVEMLGSVVGILRAVVGTFVGTETETLGTVVGLMGNAPRKHQL
jgi:hypothetical protein